MFGKTLRSLRKENQMTMSALARHLGVSNSYLSDVERDITAPLTAKKIIAAADFLSIDPMLLLVPAIASRDSIKLDVRDLSPTAVYAAANLLMRWGSMDDSQCMRLVVALSPSPRVLSTQPVGPVEVWRGVKCELCGAELGDCYPTSSEILCGPCQERADLAWNEVCSAHDDCSDCPQRPECTDLPPHKTAVVDRQCATCVAYDGEICALHKVRRPNCDDYDPPTRCECD